jgi:DNA modification methylase
MIHIVQGDARVVLPNIRDQSVHCCVTSPPYFGLRDYGVAGQMGLEQTPDAYVGELVSVFREVRRVLRDDGTLWLNLGDSYAGSWGAQSRERYVASSDPSWHGSQIKNHPKRASNTGTIRQPGLKPKDIIGIPWRVAFALQADGWYLRQDIIWHKPNPMPESVTDRCTKAHEYIFLLTKSRRYFYDREAIAEPISTDPKENYPARAKVTGRGKQGADDARGADRDKSGGFPPHMVGANGPDRPSKGVPNGAGGLMRNKRSVWTVSPKPFKEAHFATFPPALIEPCILAGCPEGGIVLDPFGGAGTTGLIAKQHDRDALLIELNPDYVKMAQRRLFAATASPSRSPEPAVPAVDPPSDA